MTRKPILALAACMAAVLLGASPAHAAFPGANGKIAFVGLDPNQTDAIFTVNPDGSDLNGPLVAPTIGDDDPGWSADGARIVFTHHISGSPGGLSQVWVMNADGGAPTKLTTGNTDCQPAFLPDGRVAFVRSANFCPESGDIWIRNVNGTEVQLTTHLTLSADTGPTGSPDNQTIAFSRGDIQDAQIFTVSAAGGTPTAVTTDHAGNQDCQDGSAFNCLDSNPNYSPGGGTIAFDRCVSGEGCGRSSGPGGALNIATVPASGGTATLLTSNNVQASDPDDCQPAYSPTGTRLVFTHMTGTFNCNEAFASTLQIAFMTPPGPVQPSVTGRNPDWQPTAVPPSSGSGGGVAGLLAGDLATCFHESVTIFGTTGNDKIVGTPGNDVIRGFGGKDKINGKGGEDILCGGRANDKIFGKNGDDILIGGDGSDFLKGGPGINRLFGGTPGAPIEKANNVCVGGKNDTLSNCQVTP